MQIILIIVMVKKGSGATSTLTKIAVIRKTTKMTVRLPDIRSFWGILNHKRKRKKRKRNETYIFSCRAESNHWKQMLKVNVNIMFRGVNVQLLRYIREVFKERRKTGYVLKADRKKTAGSTQELNYDSFFNRNKRETLSGNEARGSSWDPPNRNGNIEGVVSFHNEQCLVLQKRKC